MDWLWTYTTQFIQTEVIGGIPKDSIRSEFIRVRNTATNTYERVRKTQVSGQEQVYEAMEAHLAPYFLGNEQLNPANKFVDATLVASLQFDAGATARAREQAAQEVSVTRGVVAEDEIIVRRGEVVTPEIKQRLESLERVRMEQNVPDFFGTQSAGKALLVFCVYGIFFCYLFVARRKIFDSIKDILMIALLYIMVVSLLAVAVRIGGITLMFAVPVVIVSIVLTVAYDARVGWFGTVVVALLGGLIAGTELGFGFALATLVAGSMAILTVPGARNRAQLLVIVLASRAGYFVVFLALGLFEGSIRQLPERLLMVGANTVLLTMAVPLMWVMERIFNVSTEVRLVELTDYDHPLLKRLQQEAPGTFNHSMQVAGLAEAAAEAIGANVLLVRVGALYHDVGKLEQSAYFIENQQSGTNPHDALTPHQSAEIILNHVTHGLRLAEKHRLPENVTEFITTHHGTSLTAYFYYKASQAGKPVDEALFRYSGPRPQSKETGILMLADGVEAACKSIKEPNQEKILERVESIFKSRIEDGQLDDSRLTFKDLKIIRQTLIKRLSVIYHVRVKYPGQE